MTFGVWLYSWRMRLINLLFFLFMMNLQMHSKWFKIYLGFLCSWTNNHCTQQTAHTFQHPSIRDNFLNENWTLKWIEAIENYEQMRTPEIGIHRSVCDSRWQRDLTCAILSDKIIRTAHECIFFFLKIISMDIKNCEYEVRGKYEIRKENKQNYRAQKSLVLREIDDFHVCGNNYMSHWTSCKLWHSSAFYVWTKNIFIHFWYLQVAQIPSL